MLYVLSGGGITNVAGVIRVSYPANSTLVVKGTSSGKQFAKDTNTTSSAKAYIFLAPIGNASYTLTATNSAGQTVSKQVYVAKDQVQSVTLAYFSATIKITYPAKSTCVIKNSSGTQVDSDTNTGTTAKTWTATVSASGTYTITATATSGGKTKSTTVSITTDGQSKSVTLAYDYIIFSNATGLNSVYSDGGGGAPVEIGTDSSGKKTLTFTTDGYSRMSYLKPAIDLTNYATLKISGYADGSDSYLAFWSKIPQEYDPSIVAKVVLSNGSSPASYTIDVSKLSGSHYLGGQYAAAYIVTYDLRLE
jgi:hypothetical protein